MCLEVNETIISEAAIMTERAKAIVSTVARECFEQNINDREEWQRLAVNYKDNAILIDMAVSLLYDVQQLLKDVAKGRKE